MLLPLSVPQLHAAERYEGLTGNALYVSSKIAFGFNYIDGDLDITHDNDQQGDHGTHVAGIVAANLADGSVTGVAPQAQLMILKVFPDGSTDHGCDRRNHVLVLQC